MKRVITAVLLLLAFSVPGLPQKTASVPWWTSPVVQDLGLSREQTARIHQIVRSYRDRLFDARNASTKAEANLEDILNDPHVSLAEARPVIERLAGARANTTRLFTSMSVEIRAVLTPEQWRQLVKRWAEVQQTRRGRDTQVSP